MSNTYQGNILEGKSDLVIQHYGVIGMKWGVHRARRYASKNEKLQKKAYQPFHYILMLLQNNTFFHSLTQKF